jgi:endonuclease-3
MRTSRISRETTKVVSALASSPRRSTRTTSASFARFLSSDHNGVKIEVKSEDNTEAGSSDGEAISTRKRKRGSDKLATFEYEHKVTETVNDAPKKQRTRRQPAKRIKKESGEVEIAPPTKWEQVYSLTKTMRSPGGAAYPAVVDTMGCERLADRKTSPRDQRFQTLIALMLSSQTKDTVTAAAIKDLMENLPGGLCLEAILGVDPVRLDQLIGKVGFHNNKTRFIKQAAIDIRDKFNGEIPDTIEGLTSLAGVGPKMGYLCLSAAWGRTEGIGVDVHVHRITNLWGWHKTKNPEETRAMLESWLPKEKWHEINWLLVGFGQRVCLPVGRKCGECMLAEEGLCPASTVRRTVKKEVKEEVVEHGSGGDVKIKKEVEVEEKENAALSTIGDIEDGGLLKRERPR